LCGLRPLASCSQTIYALRTLRTRGLPAISIHLAFRAVIVAKLTYASSAWWSFTTASERQRLEAVICRDTVGLFDQDCKVTKYL